MNEIKYNKTRATKVTRMIRSIEKCSRGNGNWPADLEKLQKANIYTKCRQFGELV